MAEVRMLVNLEHTADAAAENTVSNTFYLDTIEVGATPDYGALAQDTCGVWNSYTPFTVAHNRIVVRAYDMDDDVPREPRATRTLARTGTGAACAPREVALCLSFFADRNLPRRRGRLYVGPYSVSQMEDRPSTTSMNALAALAGGISGLGGINVRWVQHSPTDGSFNVVTDWWVDNAWDTQRRRGLDPTTRISGTVSG